MRSALRAATGFVAVTLALLAPGAIGAQVASPRPLTLDDYGPWSRITGVGLSPDGQWLTWGEVPNDGDSRFFVRSLEGERLFEHANGSSATFSSDGRWVAFFSAPAEEEATKLRRERKPVPRTLHLIDLTSGAETEEVGVRAFAFGGDGRFLAVHRDRQDPESEYEGSDLLLRDLSQGTVLSLGNVAHYAFNEAGTHLAYIVDAASEAGNGVYLVSTVEGRLQPLATAAARFDDLAWNESGDALVALQGTTPEGGTLRENVLVVATQLTGTPSVTRWNPADDPSFPDGFVLSELAPTRWLGESPQVVVGIKEQEAEFKDERDDDEKPDVDVWHWRDDRLQSQQIVQASGDRRYTYTSIFDTEARRFVRLATEDMPRVDVGDEGRWGIGNLDAPYRGDVTVAGGRADLVRIDLATGESRAFATGVRRPMGRSPDDRWFVYAQDETVYLTDLQTLETRNLTEATGIDFIDREFDVIAERPAHGVAGWTEGAEAVLLNTRFDVVAVPTGGGAAVDLTGGMGAREQIEFRVVRLDPEADWVDPDQALLSAYGERTKKSGYFAMRPGSDPSPLLFGDERIGRPTRAADADRVAFTRETFTRFPDVWVSDGRFDTPRQITDANPQIADFAWGRRVLIDYTDARGHALQATLTLPAGYQEGERYPMVIYFYEKMSQRHHEFSLPVYDDRPHMSTYASNGYLVLMPDIVYEPGKPGTSALDDVTSAAQRVIDLGYADPDRIGLQGHSWGGYESSFIVTQTDMFAAVVTGAPLTNLMSMYNINYKSSGSGNGPILEWSQGRLGTTPWDDFELFVSQSPIHHAPGISTPFVILHGTDDGAVDWNQGLEFYNAARRLGKEVILLSYPGEPHHLAREANQKDFQTRMRQFFDHYLRGEPAPSWIEQGVPFLQKGREGPKIIS